MVTQGRRLLAAYIASVVIASFLIAIAVVHEQATSLPGVVKWFLAPGTFAALFTVGVHSDAFAEAVVFLNAMLYIVAGLVVSRVAGHRKRETR